MNDITTQDTFSIFRIYGEINGRSEESMQSSPQWVEHSVIFQHSSFFNPEPDK